MLLQLLSEVTSQELNQLVSLEHFLPVKSCRYLSSSNTTNNKDVNMIIQIVPVLSNTIVSDPMDGFGQGRADLVKWSCQGHSKFFASLIGDWRLIFQDAFHFSIYPSFSDEQIVLNLVLQLSKPFFFVQQTSRLPRKAVGETTWASVSLWTASLLAQFFPISSKLSALVIHSWTGKYHARWGVWKSFRRSWRCNVRVKGTE